MALFFLRQNACRIWRGAGFSQIVSCVTKRQSWVERMNDKLSF